MTLDDFESHISDKILERGLDYFDSQAVERLEEASPGEWEAEVSGSADYEVRISLDGRQITDWSCDCPYDGGPVCKHVAAVLYALHRSGPARTQAKPGREAKPKNGPLGFEELLDQLSIEELRGFVRQQHGQSRDFGRDFMLFFAEKNPQMDTGKKYQEIVRELAVRHSSRGFMDYQGTFSFARAMMPVLNAAEQAIARHDFRNAQIIAETGCLEVMKVVKACDDSAGNIGGVMASGIGILKQIARSPDAPPEQLGRLLDWAGQQLADAEWFSYGDMGYDLLQVAETAASRTDVDRFLSLIDRLLASEVAQRQYNDYLRDALRMRKIRFLQTIGRQAEAEAHVARHLDIVEIRRGIVEQAIGELAYARAKALIGEGIRIAEEKNHPGTVRKWEETLLRIAQLEQDQETIRQLTKRFAFDGRLEIGFYRQWKATFTGAEWPSVLGQQVQEIIAAETGGSRQSGVRMFGHGLFGRLAPIYIEEQEWEKLLHLIPAEPGEHVMRQVHPYLAPRYPAEMLQLYLAALEKTAGTANGRSAYQDIAGLMIQIKRDIQGSRAAIDGMAEQLIQAYPRRRAMTEELRKVLKAK